MGLRDSVEAYRRAGHAADFHSWPKDEAIAGLRSLVKQLEAGPDGARLVCRPGLKPDGSATLWLYVTGAPANAIAPEDDDGGPMDHSHPCPPWCP